MTARFSMETAGSRCGAAACSPARIYNCMDTAIFLVVSIFALCIRMMLSIA